MEVTITTKYNIGDTLYFLKENKITKGIVNRISAHLIEEGGDASIAYILYTLNHSYIGIIEEYDLYPAQDDLINAIRLDE